MKGVKVKTTLERTIYLDLPDNASEEDIINKAKEEVIHPLNAFYTATQALKSLHVNIPKLDLSDWSSADISYNIIK